MDNVNIKYLQEQLQRSLVAIRELKKENARLSNAEGDEIAVVAVSCKLPYKNDSTSKFWESIAQGKDLVTKIPKDRWNTEKYYHPDENRKNTYYTEYAGIYEGDLKQFDATFFNISPAEVKYMDPQQRLLLELSFETFENANIPLEAIKKDEIGVFIGMASYDNAIRLHKSDANISAYSGVGNALSGGAGRIAHFLGLGGPAITMDTACSSSLVALHQACKSIQRKECTTALVGGANILLSPEVMVNFSQANMLSKDGKCKTFDDSANGYVRGEGVGMIMIKSLAQAKKDNNSIIAIVKGSAINHDGRAAGITVPNGKAQEIVLKKALKDAKLTADQVNYIECHGTGTPLGDPIEFQAISEVYGHEHSLENKLHLGSLKTNIGHLEAAAGIAGLVKLLLCLQNKTLVPHLHFKKPSSYISWDKFPQMEVVQERKDWPLVSGQEKRRAGISSFGFTGTNAHVILEEYVETESKPLEVFHESNVLTLSAKSTTSLENLCNLYEEYLKDTSDNMANIAFTSNIGRTHFPYRLSFVGSNKEDIIRKLAKNSVERPALNDPKIAFLFTGQGSQYFNMGKDLYDTNSFFREKIIQCDQLFRKELNNTSIIDILYTTENQELIHQTQYTQCALFTIEFALASLWKHWGIKPKVYVGHSIGELVAACCAGVFSLEDGVKLIAKRGQLMASAKGHGVMYSIAMKSDSLEPYIDAVENVSIAVVNTASQCVLSGDKENVENVLEKLPKDTAVKQLTVSHAFHSPLMEDAKNELYKLLQSMSLQIPDTPIISNLNGEILLKEMATPEYWANQVVATVRFDACAKKIAELEVDACLEIGPKPILSALVSNTLKESMVCIPSLRNARNTMDSMAKAVGSIYELGGAIKWKKFHQDSTIEMVSLPNYPFQRKYYWLENGNDDTLDRRSDRETVSADSTAEEANTVDLYIEDWILKDRHATSEKSESHQWILVDFKAQQENPFRTYLQQKEEQGILNLALESWSENEVSESFKNISADFHVVVNPGSTEDYVSDMNRYGYQFVALFQLLEKLQKSHKMISLTVLGTANSEIQVKENPIQNGLATLSKVIENEMFSIKVKRVFVDQSHRDSLMEEVEREILHTQKTSTVWLSEKTRKVLRLKSLISEPESKNEALFSSDKSYLITGGTGALGTKLIDWMLDNGASNLVVVTRQKNHSNKNIKESIEMVQADIANPNDVDQLISRFGIDFKPLGGVFHLAGVLSDASVLTFTEDQFNSVLSPKVNGTWNLHQATKKLTLDYFVQFSSISSVIGAIGLGNYAYANSFLDSISEMRKSENLPCLNVNWGPWDGGGMAEDLDDSKIIINKIPIAEGFETLGKLMRLTQNGSYTVTILNHELLREIEVPLLDLLQDKESSTENSSTEDVQVVLTEVTIENVKQIIADVLEITPEELDTTIPIISYGFDSLLALKAKNVIHKKFGVNLEASAFMENPSINDLKDAIIKSKETIEVKEEEVIIDKEISLNNIDELTEDEIDKLLKSLE